MNEILRLKDISLIYHSAEEETLALADINFSVNKGQFTSIIGPSGCGKTSVLSLIAGLIKPTRGEILLEGKPLDRSGSDIGYMLQKDHLLPWRSVYKNIRLGLEIKGKINADTLENVDSLILKYGLGEFTNHLPYQLSGGMKQRAALIRTLAFRPKLLLLDEPFSALDYQTRLSVCDDVYSIIENEGKTAILVTHDISEAISMSDKIIVLTKRPGRIKNVYNIDLRSCSSPLKRREHPLFPQLFEKIWGDIRDEQQQ